MIGIVDYGMGNIKSVVNAFKSLGADIRVSQNSGDLSRATAIVLPGVGAFGRCIENLIGYGLDNFVKAWIRANRPYLGICLGMQILFDSSEEAPGVQGLGLIKGRALRFPGDLKVPHMGWNSINFDSELKIYHGIRDGEFFYFVHSYYCQPDEAVAATTTDYGIRFTSSIRKGNVFACQFHPEKSQGAGLSVLKNFIDIIGESEHSKG